MWKNGRHSEEPVGCVGGVPTIEGAAGVFGYDNDRAMGILSHMVKVEQVLKKNKAEAAEANKGEQSFCLTG